MQPCKQPPKILVKKCNESDCALFKGEYDLGSVQCTDKQFLRGLDLPEYSG